MAESDCIVHECMYILVFHLFVLFEIEMVLSTI